MVNGLIKYNKLGLAVMLLRDFNEEFKMSATEKVTMADWNPLLVAIAFKKIDIVRYLINELQVSVRQWTTKPDDLAMMACGDNFTTAENQIFGLYLAAHNKDINMLKELWNLQYLAWEEIHLQRLMKHLIAFKWGDGIKAVLSSYTSHILFSS